MGIASKKGKEFREVATEKRSNPVQDPNPSVDKKVSTTSKSAKKSRRRQNQQKKETVAMAPSRVQRLYDTCKEVFACGGTGIVPSPDKIEKLKAVLDVVGPADVGLNPEMTYFRRTVPGRTHAIKYLHIYECNKFSMGIFCLPPSGVLPLHNHPGMTVFSKLLFGTMHIKSYDWAVDLSEVKQPESQQSEVKQPEVPGVLQSNVRLAKLKVDSDFTAPCDTSILYPSDGGNLHCFTAVTACAVLDVLGPPYSDPDGRHCTYYFDFPFANFSVDGISVPEEESKRYAWLQEREKPENLLVVGETYSGPKIVK